MNIPETRRRGTVPAALNRTHTDNVRVDSARDAVVDLEVELGEHVLCERRHDAGGDANKRKETAFYDQ